MGEQNLILIPHLASLRIVVNKGDQFSYAYQYFIIGVMYLILSAVLDAGVLFILN